MFERHKQKKAEKQYQAELRQWEEQRQIYSRRLAVAVAVAEAKASPGEQSDEILLKPGELWIARLESADLIEPRRERGHWEGGSSGISVPIGSLGGRAVRYRSGASRGTYVQGETVATIVDTGTAYVTSRRVIFAGAKQTRECLFDKLLGIQYDDQSGHTTISVSNRQKPTTIGVGPDLTDEFKFALDVAVAHYRGNVVDLITQLKQHLAELDASKPLPIAA